MYSGFSVFRKTSGFEPPVINIYKIILALIIALTVLASSNIQKVA
jgi:hypothetical protein